MKTSRSRIHVHVVAALTALLAIGLLPAHGQSTGRPGRGSIGMNGPKPGSAALDFELKTTDGKSVKASEWWKKKPLVVMTGSHTCPVFRGKVSPFESLAKEFGDRVNFLVIYTVEAHPKGDPSPYSGKEWTTQANEKMGLSIRQPKTMDERLERARACIKSEKLSVPVVVDTMENKVWKDYGSAPNCAYLIGSDGKILAAEPWMEPDKLRSAIREHVRSAKP